eukprot:6192634-Karenia_brevis.AAC.2
MEGAENKPPELVELVCMEVPPKGAAKVLSPTPWPAEVDVVASNDFNKPPAGESPAQSPRSSTEGRVEPGTDSAGSDLTVSLSED